ncbi:MULTISPECIES: DUF6702 family protein [unclassified Duganella]|uniref:DUF6702 family protein n=1 Tax=unclassified Duganella TaxID=2636909 RepID=UPI00087FC536|nr:MULTISPECIES: DUF6702 family protein [unclassified Duganella]SDG44147.1 hypothetical protein SAMN05216320_104350 [Duganella sp. OV458]SDJ59763.1 hypothetical protein SAMN05428973_10553 [Duganella sp. OV510]
MILRRLRAVAATVLALAGTAAHAHNFHMGMADISYNERTGSTEIVHTYTGHDLTALLTNLYGRQFDLGRADSEAPLRRYVEKQFIITGPDGKQLPLQWVGARVDADSVVIFQEIPRTRLAKGDRIHNALLIDFLPSQKNTVNLQTDGTTKTLIFDQQNIDQIAP